MAMLHWLNPKAAAVSLCIVALGCRHEPSTRWRDHHAPRTARQFWLMDTALLVAPRGKPKQHVDGPLLVELLPDGRVRGVKPNERGIEGYLPKTVLTRPGHEQGLMLYVQTLTELRYQGILGPVIGRLHPGAFVSVVPSGSTGMLVGSLPFRAFERSTVVGYARADAFGIERREAEDFRGNIGDRSYVVGEVMGPHFDDLGSEGPRWWPCEPILFAEQSRFGTQYLDGVELRGWTWSSPSEAYPGYPRTHSYSDCPARHVVRRGSEFVLVTSRERVVVPVVPPTFALLRDDGRDVLRHWIETEQPIFLLVMNDEKTVTCAALRFDRPRTRLTADQLVLDAELRHSRGREGGIGYLPMHYFVPKDRSRSTLLVLDDEHPGFSVFCDKLRYTLVYTDSIAFRLLAHAIPDDAIAYDPAEVEPWFKTEAVCQEASAEATRILNTRGSLAHTLGLHVVSRGHTASRCDDPIWRWWRWTGLW